MNTPRKKYIVFGSPLVGREEIKEVVETLKSGWLGTGPRVSRFEDLVKKRVGTKYAMALNSCTAALHLSLLASGIKPGDEVITTPLTFCATANAIIHAGAKPVFVDVKKETMNIDEDKIEAAITEKTKAIVPVHFAGRPCDMDKIMKIAKKHHLTVIEDAAHALGATYHGTPIGNIGHLTCFSFYVTKNITTGEGGMVTTNSRLLAEKIKVLGLHGLSRDAWKRYSDNGYKHYEVTYPGYKYNMMDLQAAIGLHQIQKMDRYSQHRQKLWNFYNEHLKKLPVILPTAVPSDIIHARHLYTILVDSKKTGLTRDEFMQALHRQGIGTGVHFLPLHLHHYYKKQWGYQRGDFPNTEYIGARTVSLPLSAKITRLQAKGIVKTIWTILQKSSS